jgi:hypothetical protein
MRWEPSCAKLAKAQLRRSEEAVPAIFVPQDFILSTNVASIALKSARYATKVALR